MTTNYTTGPWCIHRGYANAETIRCDDNGESWEFTHTHIGAGDKIVAQVQHQSKDSGWPHVHEVEEMWANARLIAAAPEMLDALKKLHACHRAFSGSDDWSVLDDEVRAEVEAMIAKAEGSDA